MVISVKDMKDAMQREQERLLPTFLSAIDNSIRGALGSEFQFCLTVEANGQTDDLFLQDSVSHELLKLRSNFYWEPAMMTQFVQALAKVYQEAGWVVKISGLELEVDISLSF